MITCRGLERLGFDPFNDFKLADNGDGVVYIAEWYSSKVQPSEAEITQAEEVAQAEYDAQEYARLRKVEYDKLNQFEMQFDDQVNGTTTWVDAINEIKAKYPKE